MAITYGFYKLVAS